MRFVDTNVILYAISTNPDDQEKRQIAYEILLASDLAFSSQILQEFYVQATRTTRNDRLSHHQAVALINVFARFPVQPTTLEIVRAALVTCKRYQISYWDAAILEAARTLGCSEVLTDDLNHGQSYDGLLVVNPFAS